MQLNGPPPSKEDKTAGILYMERIFVGNLDNDITESMLNALFLQFGHCESKIIREKNGTSKGYGFVTFNDAKPVEALVQQRTIKLNNRTLNIGLAIRRIKHPEQMSQMQLPYPINHLSNSMGYMPPPFPYVPSSAGRVELLTLGNQGNLLGNHGNAAPLLGAPAAHLPAWSYVPHF